MLAKRTLASKLCLEFHIIILPIMRDPTDWGLTELPEKLFSAVENQRLRPKYPRQLEFGSGATFE